MQTDLKGVLEVLQTNIPTYFAEEEREDFIDYLNKEREHYYVVEHKGVIVGNGGFNYLQQYNVVRISWDMISLGAQNLGIGSKLLSFRLKKIEALYPETKIIVRTSQHAYLFYQKGGFKLLEIVKDYWADGFDLYHMRFA